MTAERCCPRQGRQLSVTLETWRDGQVIDVVAAMDEIAARISARTLFTAHLSPEQSAELLDSITAVVEGIFLRTVMPPALQRAPLSANRRFDRALSRLDGLTYEIIDGYRHDGVDHGDMLSMLLVLQR